jgi:hypothetical protein
MTINILIVLLASVTTYIYIAVMLAVGLLLVHAGFIQSALQRWFCSQQAGVAETKDFIESKAEAKATCCKQAPLRNNRICSSPK